MRSPRMARALGRCQQPSLRVHVASGGRVFEYESSNTGLRVGRFLVNRQFPKRLLVLRFDNFSLAVLAISR
jgi:hypothetical protein